MTEYQYRKEIKNLKERCVVWGIFGVGLGFFLGVVYTLMQGGFFRG